MFLSYIISNVFKNAILQKNFISWLCFPNLNCICTYHLKFCVHLQIHFNGIVMKKLIFILIAAVICGSCNGRYEHETIPNVDLRFTIYPNSTTYLNLNYYGGYEYFTGGVAGVIVYRLDETTFFAYDRACPYDWEDPDSWLWVDESGILIVDYCCGAKFNILDGTPVSGPTTLPLKHYKCRYDGASLLVYN